MAAKQVKRVLTGLEKRKEVVMLDALITDMGGNTRMSGRAAVYENDSGVKAWPLSKWNSGINFSACLILIAAIDEK